MSKTLSPEKQKMAENLLQHYPEPAAALLPMLHLAESDFGVIDDEAEQAVAELCQVSQEELPARTDAHRVLAVPEPGARRRGQSLYQT